MLEAHSFHCHVDRLVVALIMVLGIQWMIPTVFAGEPDIQFDLPVVLACRQVELDELADTADLDAAECVIEAMFPLSLRIRSGDVDAVEQISIEILTNDDQMRIVDFAPKTQVKTDITGEVEQKKTTEVSNTLGASLGGGVPLPYGALIAQVTPSANAGINQRHVMTESIKRLPPMEPTIVSGTTHRGRGVFFQLRRSSQSTLEGTQGLSVRFAVPSDWRIARASAVCRASGYDRLLWMKKETTWSSMKLPVILYAEGDPDAKAAAERAAAKWH